MKRAVVAMILATGLGVTSAANAVTISITYDNSARPQLSAEWADGRSERSRRTGYFSRDRRLLRNFTRAMLAFERGPRRSAVAALIGDLEARAARRSPAPTGGTSALAQSLGSPVVQSIASGATGAGSAGGAQFAAASQVSAVPLPGGLALLLGGLGALGLVAARRRKAAAD